MYTCKKSSQTLWPNYIVVLKKSVQATQIESLKPPNLNVSKENRRVGFCLIVDPQFWRYFGPHFYRLLEILGNRCVEDSGLAKDFYLREPEEERE